MKAIATAAAVAIAKRSAGDERRATGCGCAILRRMLRVGTGGASIAPIIVSSAEVIRASANIGEHLVGRLQCRFGL